MEMQQDQDSPRERRATEKLRRYWSSIADDNAIPKISGLAIQLDDPEWRKRFLLKEDSDPPRSVFIFCGTTAEPFFESRPLSKTMIDVAPPHLRDRLCRHCEDVTGSLRIADDGGSYWEDGEEVFYRYILLPIASSSHDRGYIVGAFSSSLQESAARQYAS